MSDYIPTELLREIFVRVPAEPLFRFRFACKAWRDIIDDPMFTKSHFYRHKGINDRLFIRHKSGKQLYSVSFASLEKHGRIVDQVTNIKNLVGPGVPKLGKLPLPSCNGIILFAHRNMTRLWALWNPFTRESLKLPGYKHLLIDILGLSYTTCTGIGYDSIADDYKVARISVLEINVSQTRSYRLETLIYSLKSNSWKRLIGFPTQEHMVGHGVFFNGALHWISSKYLISLDLNAEKYRLAPLPQPQVEFPYLCRYCAFYFVELGEYLTLACYRSSPIRRKYKVEIWMLKDYAEAEHNTWTRFSSNYEISNPCDNWPRLMPVAYLKSTKQVVYQYSSWDVLVCYDIKENTDKEVEMDGLVGSFSFQVFPENLFRLKTNGDDSSSRKGTLKRKRKSINDRSDG